MKVNNPREVAFYSALISSVIVAGIVATVTFFLDAFDLVLILICFVAFLIVSNFIIYYFIERFLYGKIKLIYKHIRKGKEQGVGVNMKENVLENVGKEVEEWTAEKSEEIQKLREQEAFRREFLGNLSHELKTPIFSIQGYILTLLEGGLEDENVNREFLERASKGVDRMTHIIEDLDTITQFESGRLELNEKPFNIVELCEEIMDSLEYKAKKKEITLKFKEKYNNPINVIGDKGRIGQVLTNFLSNTINYGKKGGTTEVRFYRMESDILVEVADDGPGIDEEHLPRLFERFYRVDRSRSRKEGGTGLGLAIVKHIIEAHNQTLNVRSSVGVGSTFSFTLSLA